jgi:hypothetical protein
MMPDNGLQAITTAALRLLCGGLSPDVRRQGRSCQMIFQVDRARKPFADWSDRSGEGGVETLSWDHCGAQRLGAPHRGPGRTGPRGGRIAPRRAEVGVPSARLAFESRSSSCEPPGTSNRHLRNRRVPGSMPCLFPRTRLRGRQLKDRSSRHLKPPSCDQ